MRTHALDKLDIDEHKRSIQELKESLNERIGTLETSTQEEIVSMLVIYENNCLAQIRKVLDNEADAISSIIEIVEDIKMEATGCATSKI